MRMMRKMMRRVTIICSPHAGALCVLLCSAYVDKELVCAMLECCGPASVLCVCPYYVQCVLYAVCPHYVPPIQLTNLKAHTPPLGQPVHMQFSATYTGPWPLNQRTLVSPEHMNASFLFANLFAMP